MTSNIVNLNKARKAKDHADKEKRAEENRTKFGRTKQKKTSDSDEQNRRDALLDGAKVEKCENDPGADT